MWIKETEKKTKRHQEQFKARETKILARPYSLPQILRLIYTFVTQSSNFFLYGERVEISDVSAFPS